MEIGLVKKVDIDHEMQQSYLDYAMSVIVSRALPDARDGLKPVQRRILYAMHDMGMRSDSTYKKSARIVGEVLGKYHPHGDMAVYEAMARMAQDFTIRIPLVDGQGNFGSVDGDPPAAMRYTEARLTAYAGSLLEQIEQATVDFLPNFDDTLKEPDVLPAAAPNLLVNGASGIAVGMATNIPPHNLGEVVEALCLLLKEWERLDEINIEDIMRFIKGPDFPTGGIILQENGQNELLAAYATGRGKLTVRGRLHVEEMSRGRNRIIITELPYLVNKAGLVERIAELVREGTLEGIADLRDESDQHGMRVVIELKQAADTDKALRDLYHRTPLQTTFGINMLALVDGEPRLLALKQALRVYLEHRLVVVKRRSEYELERARRRAHILEGLRIALKNLDEIIALIRNAPDVETARARMIKRFKLSEEQSTAILDMPLRRLAALERKKIEDEYKELVKTIKGLEELLASPKKMRGVIESELVAVKQKFGDARKTQIVNLKEGDSAKELLTTTSITPDKAVWVGLTADGVLARIDAEHPVRFSGKDAPQALIKTSIHQTLYVAARSGKAAAILVGIVPEAEKFSEGVHFTKVTPLPDKEQIQSLFSVPAQKTQDWFVFTTTAMGLVKKTALKELPGPSAQPFNLVRINPGDQLVSAMLTDGNREILLATTDGMAIRFSENEVRAMGLVAAGVNGIKLKDGETVTGVETPTVADLIGLLSSDGKVWAIPFEEFPQQGRYGQGVTACKLPVGHKLRGTLAGKKTCTGIVNFRFSASRYIKLGEIPPVKRMRAGFEWVVLKGEDEVTGVTRIQEPVEPAKSGTLTPKTAKTATSRKVTKETSPRKVSKEKLSRVTTKGKAIRKPSKITVAEKALENPPAQVTTKEKAGKRPSSNTSNQKASGNTKSQGGTIKKSVRKTTKTAATGSSGKNTPSQAATKEKVVGKSSKVSTDQKAIKGTPPQKTTKRAPAKK